MPVKSVELPLHYGHVPSWLFKRMKRLARVLIEVIIEEYGTKVLLQRLSDAFYFQALGCLLGFDWHSSGLTTATGASIKYALNSSAYKIKAFGGKGKYSRKIPDEMALSGMRNLIKYSKLTAKIDSAGIQDGYNIYMQFFFTDGTDWVVIDQGLNYKNKYSRRYHWYSNDIRYYFSSPHKDISGKKEKSCINIVKKGQETLHSSMTELFNNKSKIEKYLKQWDSFKFPQRHEIFYKDINIKRVKNIIFTHKDYRDDFKSLLMSKGIGTKTIRALALTAHIIYGTPLSFKDPISFSYAHGGKDGIPYPVNKRIYDSTISFLLDIVKKSDSIKKDKTYMLKKLISWKKYQNF